MVRIGGVGATVILVGLGVAQPSFAQQSVLSASGFTGLSVTPTAHLLPWGSVAFAYDDKIVGGPATRSPYQEYKTTGHNFVGGFGLSPYLEISGRLASSTMQTNCFVENCGVRDLSFNFKAGVTLDEGNKFRIAVGGTDFGGQINYFRTIYGVATYSPENFDFSLGYARRASVLIGDAKPLDGIFGSIAYRPLSWLQTHVEYDDSNAWAGARVFAPAEWLPAGWVASVGANFQLRGEDRGKKNWMSLGVSIPLYKVPSTRSAGRAPSELGGADPAERTVSTYVAETPKATIREFSASGLPESPTLVVAQASTSPLPGLSSVATSVDASQAVSDHDLEELALGLKEKGFEDIYVGRMPSGAIAIQVNNATYNVNTADGLGVALGVVARRLGPSRAGYRLVLTQRQIAIVGIVGQADCLADWIAMKPPRCVAGTIHTPGTSAVSSILDSAEWVVAGKDPSWTTPRVILQPVLRTTVGSDYGVLDYSAGVRTTLQQPLWSGAYLEWSHVTPLSETEDFQPNRVYGADRIVSATDKILAHQILRIPIEKLFGENNAKTAAAWGATALTAHVAAGRVTSNYRGTYGELRWEPFDGQHRFGLEAGRFERTTAYDYFLPRQSRPVLASYRYSFMPTRTDFEITAGQYLYNDRGGQFLITQWFDDIALNLYVRRTKYDYEQVSRTFAGIELIIPLTPRKDMSPTYHVQVTGAPRWAYGIETKVGGINYISTNQGLYPGAAVLDRTFNSDRAGAAYFEENMARIRSAASR